jgi:hypothetical protein
MKESLHIHKLEVISEQKLELPKGTDFLTVIKKEDGFYLWTRYYSELTDNNKQLYKIIFCGAQSGAMPLDIDNAKYISTVYIEKDDLTYHFFVIEI